MTPRAATQHPRNATKGRKTRLEAISREALPPRHARAPRPASAATAVAATRLSALETRARSCSGRFDAGWRVRVMGVLRAMPLARQSGAGTLTAVRPWLELRLEPKYLMLQVVFAISNGLTAKSRAFMRVRGYARARVGAPHFYGYLVRDRYIYRYIRNLRSNRNSNRTPTAVRVGCAARSIPELRGISG